MRRAHVPLACTMLASCVRVQARSSLALLHVTSAEPIKVVHLKPPCFMGPPSKAPSGAMVAPPSSLPEPASLATLAVANDGHVGFARPHSMAPPKFGPFGDSAAPPPIPPKPREVPEMDAREMLAPQKLALISQLMRRIATATSEEVSSDGAKGGGLAAADLISVVQMAKQTSKPDKTSKSSKPPPKAKPQRGRRA